MSSRLAILLAALLSQSSAWSQAAPPSAAPGEVAALALSEAQQVMRQRRYAEVIALLEPQLQQDAAPPPAAAVTLYARACLLSYQARRAVLELERLRPQWETDARARRQMALCEYAIAAGEGALPRSRVPEVVAAAFCVAEREYPVDDPEIARVVQELAAESDYGLARAAYDFVRLRTRYDKSLIPLGRQDVLFTLRTGRAVCTGFAQLYVTLCRAAGVPARLVAGRGRYGFHNWAEVWLVGKGWVPVDPTRGRNRNAFGILDRDIHPYDSQRENW